MAEIIAVANQKGGVGKTTTTESLGAALASLHGERVLLVDYDPQCSLTKSLVNGGGRLERDVGSGYSLMTGDPMLAAREFDGITALYDVLEPIADDYDHIIIDCPPSLSEVALNALYPADRIIVAVQPHFLAVSGIAELFRTLSAVNAQGASIKSARCLFTMHESNGAVKEMEEQVATAYGTPYATKIRKNVAIAYAQAAGMDVFQYDKHSNAARDYAALATEILEEE